MSIKSKQGIYPNDAIDFFVGGSSNRQEGFFKDVFSTSLMEKIQVNSFNQFGSTIKEYLSEEKTVAVAYLPKASNYTHIIQIWGAEFDANGDITAIFISDSDDNQENERVSQGKNIIGMKRLFVRDDNGRVKITSSKNPKDGPIAYQLYSLSLGTEQWDAFLK